MHIPVLVVTNADSSIVLSKVPVMVVHTLKLPISSGTIWIGATWAVTTA